MPEKLFTVEPPMKRAIADRAGRLIDVYDVPFTTASGVRDTIQFRAADYENTELVKKTLGHWAQLHEGIFNAVPEITAILSRTTFGVTGIAEKMYDVTFATKEGVVDTASFTEKEYTLGEVEKTLREKIKHHEQIMKG